MHLDNKTLSEQYATLLLTVRSKKVGKKNAEQQKNAETKPKLKVITFPSLSMSMVSSKLRKN